MKFARYQAQGKVSYGVVEGDVVKEMSGTPFEKYQLTGKSHKLSEVKLLAPCTPVKMLAMALNYKSHLGDQKPPDQPEPFFKVPTSIIGPGDTIILPKNAGRIDEEAELVVVIGRRCKGVSKADALKYVLGYTIGNDVSARDFQLATSQWLMGKTFDGFAPTGPWITSADEIPDPHALDIELFLNGERMQASNTREMIFKIPDLIEFISSVLTLEPGDIVATGTPAGVGFSKKPPRWLRPGDEVVVRIEGLGELRNPVAAEP